MDKFIEQHADRISGTLGCFDRVLFRGYLPIMSGAAMAAFLKSRDVMRETLKAFLLEQAERLKSHAQDLCTQTGRPYEYLGHAARKEDLARKIAERDELTEGLVCVLSVVEPCRTFSLVWNGRSPYVQSTRRKCLHFYYYFLDRDLGLIHVKLQSWFPFQIQIYVNGREWLARQMDRRGLAYERRENCFVDLESVRRAQRLMSSQLRLNWPKHLDRIAQRLNPRHEELLPSTYGLPYYWTVYQSEWATDVMFRDPASLAEVYPRLVRHGISAFSSPDVMRFLGGKVHGNFKGEIVSDFKNRPEGVRIKHRVGANSVKLYDKQGSVLRTETTIHDADGIKVYRPKEGAPEGKKEWRPLRRGVADLHRRAEVSQASNERYLNALAVTDTSTALGELLQGLERAVTWKSRRVRGIRAWSTADVALLRAVNRGEFCINGFRNRDLQALLFDKPTADLDERRRRSARVSRLIALLRAHRLVHKVPRSHRYRLTDRGRQIITAILAAHDVSLKTVNDLAAAA